MKITKFPQSCLLIETKGKKNTIDDKILEEAQKSAEQLINKYGEVY